MDNFVQECLVPLLGVRYPLPDVDPVFLEILLLGKESPQLGFHARI
jgi:hypothetical protein